MKLKRKLLPLLAVLLSFVLACSALIWVAGLMQPSAICEETWLREHLADLDLPERLENHVVDVILPHNIAGLHQFYDALYDNLAMNMSFGREYAERLDWLLLQFKDWAFTFISSEFYYNDYDRLDETERNLYRKGMAAFGGIAPTYHIALLDKPTIVWDFYSLLLGVQMMFSFMLTDEQNPLRMCKHCHVVFAAAHPNAAFCSPKCKNQYNVYKSRAKKEG